MKRKGKQLDYTQANKMESIENCLQFPERYNNYTSRINSWRQDVETVSGTTGLQNIRTIHCMFQR